jgi:hypothetical protein
MARAKKLPIFERFGPDGRLLGYQVKIRCKGWPAVTRQFDKMDDARRFAIETLSQMEKGTFVDRREIETVTEADKGRTPWHLLAISAGLIEDSIFSKGQARAKWLEYAHVFKGRRQLVWSRGLKAKAGIAERTDEEVAAAAEEAALHEPRQEIGRLNRDEWRTLVRKGLRMELLESVEQEGCHGFERVLAMIKT